MKPVSIVVVLINTETHKVAIIWVVAIIGACTLHIVLIKCGLLSHSNNRVPTYFCLFWQPNSLLSLL